MSKSSRKAKRAARREVEQRSIPWAAIRRNGESALEAFRRAADPATLWDQQRLVRLGWKPIEAAVEAWLTAHGQYPSE